MIDYLEELLTQVAEEEEDDSEESPLFDTLSSPTFFSTQLSTSSDDLVEKDGDATSDLLAWMADFPNAHKQITVLQGQSKGSGIDLDGASPQRSAPTVDGSPSQGEDVTQGGALSLYGQLMTAQWQTGEIGRGSVPTNTNLSIPSGAPSTSAPTILSTPSTPLSQMTPQSFDTLVARDARRYDGGFTLY